jgi:predicted transposase YbfD/YdcC
MKHIILGASNTDGIAFNVADLAARLEELTDTRDKRGKIYPLGMLLTLIVLAKLAGEDKPFGIARWIRLRCDKFVELFDCKHRRMPCLNSIRWVLDEVVCLDELEQVFIRYLHNTFSGQESQLTSIDGKTMRGTIPQGESQGVHLLAAYLPEEGIVLKQIEVGHKENEIVAASQLIEALYLKDKVVCGDAMQTQRGLSVDILAKGGNYLWFLKGNQPTSLDDVQRFFEPPQRSSAWPLPELPRTDAETKDKSHGRLERRTLTLMVDDDGFLDWPGVKQVYRIERYRRHLRSGKENIEVVYGITSCDPKTSSAAQLLHWTRAYWGIENGLHYRRDVTLREDATRTSQRTLAKVLAAINNLIVAIAQKLTYSNLAAARRVFDARIAAQLW